MSKRNSRETLIFQCFSGVFSLLGVKDEIMGHRAVKVKPQSGEREQNEEIYKRFAGAGHGIWDEYERVCGGSRWTQIVILA